MIIFIHTKKNLNDHKTSSSCIKLPMISIVEEKNLTIMSNNVISLIAFDESRILFFRKLYL